jgi:hypothetical protein
MHKFQTLESRASPSCAIREVNSSTHKWRVLTWSRCISYICFILILITRIYTIPDWSMSPFAYPYRYLRLGGGNWFLPRSKKIPTTRSLPYGTCYFTYGTCTNGIWNTKVPCFLMAFGYSMSKARGIEHYFLSLSNKLTREWMLSVLMTLNIELC